MIFFQEKPSKEFENLVTYTLNDVIDSFERDLTVSKKEYMECAGIIFERDVLKMFPPKVMLSTLKNMLAANEDRQSLFSFNDFHWLILHRLLASEIPYIKDKLRDGFGSWGEDDGVSFVTRSGKTLKRKCQEDYIFDVYFWDDDFDLTCFRSATKIMLKDFGCNSELLKVVNRIKPTEDELKILYMKPISPKMSWDWNGVAEENRR